VFSNLNIPLCALEEWYGILNLLICDGSVLLYGRLLIWSQGGKINGIRHD
jgi:hypothetical protein